MRALLLQNARRAAFGVRNASIKANQEFFQNSHAPTYAKKNDFGALDIMLLSFFVVSPFLYINGAESIRGQKNKKD